jgi:ribosomal protein S18 acetylase RimI-like enzyme
MSEAETGPIGALRIAPLTEGRCDEAGAIVGQNPLWHERYRYGAERAAADLRGGVARGELIWGATGAGGEALLGFAWVVPNGAFSRWPYLRLLGVAPQAQGRGVGARLLDHAEEQLRDRSRHLFLLASEFNEGAQRFYARQGYRQIGAIPEFVLPGVAEQIWMKKI